MYEYEICIYLYYVYKFVNSLQCKIAKAIPTSTMRRIVVGKVISIGKKLSVTYGYLQRPVTYDDTCTSFEHLQTCCDKHWMGK